MGERVLGSPPSLPAGSAWDAPTSPAHRLPAVDRQKVDPGIVKAAEGMEAMFLDYLMKVMRESVPDESTGADSAAHQIYGGMRDSEFSKMAAKRGGIGLSDQIIAYLESQRYTGKQGSKADSAVKTGQLKPGSQEGQ